MKRDELPFYVAMAALFAGLWIKFDLGTALIVLGGTGVTLSSATSFFVTWLGSKAKER